MNLLTRHLTGIADFQGRENRQPFWLWILIVYIVQFVVMAIAMIPLMTSWFDQMMPMMQGDPHRFDNDPQAMIQLMMPMMQNMITMTVVSAVLFLVLPGTVGPNRFGDDPLKPPFH